MKKSVKGIIGLSAALVVLGGGAAALLLTEPKDDGGDSSSITSEVEKQVKMLIYDDKAAGTDAETGEQSTGIIKTVNVKNKTDEYLVVQQSKAADGEDPVYTIDGYQDVNMDNVLIRTLVNNANGLSSEDVVEENCTDLEKFGLADPEAAVDIEYETGTKCRMFIGNQTPSAAEKYVMLDGENTVYTVRVSAVANYSKALTDFVSTTILQKPEVYPVVEKLTVSRKDSEADLVLEYDVKSDDSEYRGGTSSTHIMTSPTDAHLTVERSTDIITGMFGLESSSLYSVHCTEAEIAEAGLKDAFCTVTMECDDGNDYKLLISEFFEDDNGKSCYCMLEGSNVIYVLSAEKAIWTTVEPVDVASRMFIVSYVWNVTDLSVECGGKLYDFEITQTVEAGEDENLTSANFTTTLNGENFDSERYRKFYSFLIKANAESFALGEDIPQGEPMAVLEYTDGYTRETVKCEFYEKSSLQALVVIDGESKFNIAKSYVETLIENAENLKSDTEFKTTWK